MHRIDSLEPRDWCIAYLRPYVERGDRIATILSGQGGAGGPASDGRPQYHVCIGGYLWWGERVTGDHGLSIATERRSLKRDEIGAVIGAYPDERVGIYRVTELAAEIRSGATQMAMFGGAR